MAEISPNERILRDMFPGQATLSPEDLAQALMGKRTRGVANGIREKLRNEDLIPGLRKVGNVWRIPIGKGAAVLDQLTDPLPPPTKRSRRAVQGPIFLKRRERTGEFLRALLAAYLRLEAAGNRAALEAVAVGQRAQAGRSMCSACGRPMHEGDCRTM